jgi:hypothetical protein
MGGVRFKKGKTMVRKLIGLAMLSALSTTICAGEDTAKVSEVANVWPQALSVRFIAPIFSQLVTFSLPKGFVPAFEDAKSANYIQESVLAGESVSKWTQMITITGAKNLAMNQNVTPIRFADSVAGGFKRVCPNSFNATTIGEKKFGTYSAFSVVTSCGTASPTKEQYSESLLLIVIKGEKDYYTIQWAERGTASELPIKFDNATWTDRLNRLMPIDLCPRMPGEAAPYPSCVDRK